MTLPTAVEAAATADSGVPATFAAIPLADAAIPTAPANLTVSTNTAGPSISNSNGTTFFTADDLSRARQQEKEKLYPQIETLKSQLDVLVKDREERVAEETARREAAEADARAKAEAEMTALERLEATQRDWESKFAALEAEREADRALVERERRHSELLSYRANAIEAQRENIHPDLLDLVSGETPEEIDASIAGLVARTARIIEGVQQAFNGQPSSTATPGARVTSPPAGPMDTYTEQRSFSAAEIAQMDAKTYGQYRESLLGTAAASRNKGLFG